MRVENLLIGNTGVMDGMTVMIGQMKFTVLHVCMGWVGVRVREACGRRGRGSTWDRMGDVAVI